LIGCVDCVIDAVGRLVGCDRSTVGWGDGPVSRVLLAPLARGLLSGEQSWAPNTGVPRAGR